MGNESREAVAPASEAEAPVAELPETEAPAEVPSDGIEFTHADGTVHRAETIEMAQRLCPVIGKMAVKEVEFMVQLAADAKAQREKEESEKVESEESVDESATAAEVDVAEASSDTTSGETSMAASENSAGDSSSAETVSFSFDTAAEAASTESSTAGQSNADTAESDSTTDAHSDTASESESESASEAELSDTQIVESTDSEEAGGGIEDQIDNRESEVVSIEVENISGEPPDRSELLADETVKEQTPQENALEIDTTEPEDDIDLLEVIEGDVETEPSEYLEDNIEHSGETTEIIEEQPPEMTDAVVAFLRSPVHIHDEETDVEGEVTFAEIYPIVAEVADKLEALEGEEKEEANEQLELIVEAVNEIERLEEEGATVEEIEQAEAELKEYVVELFKQLGIEYTDEDVEQFIKVMRKAHLEVKEDTLEELLEPAEDGTHEYKTQATGIAAIIDKAEHAAKRLIGKLAIFHVTRQQPQEI